MCWNSYQSHKSQPYHLLGEIREWINNPADSIKLSITASFTQGGKMHMLFRSSVYSQTKIFFFFFSLLSPHQIISYGFLVVKLFGFSLRRSLNINVSLNIKIMPQWDRENFANTLESIVANRVEASNVHLWYLICALEISQSYFLWSELLQWYLKINWMSALATIVDGPQLRFVKYILPPTVLFDSNRALVKNVRQRVNLGAD